MSLSYSNFSYSEILFYSVYFRPVVGRLVNFRCGVGISTRLPLPQILLPYFPKAPFSMLFIANKFCPKHFELSFNAAKYAINFKETLRPTNFKFFLNTAIKLELNMLQELVNFYSRKSFCTQSQFFFYIQVHFSIFSRFEFSHMSSKHYVLLQACRSSQLLQTQFGLQM